MRARLAASYLEGVVGRPLLLVDIDGVLSPYAAERCPDGFAEYTLFPDDPEPHRLCLQHGAWLTELAGHYDLVWGSAWGLVVHEKLSPILQLHEFAYVPMPDIPFPPADKVPAIDRYVGCKPVAWIDDMIVEEARAWAAARMAPTLLVETDPAVGMTRGHVEQLLAWAAALPAMGAGNGSRAVRSSGGNPVRTSSPLDRGMKGQVHDAIAER